MGSALRPEMWCARAEKKAKAPKLPTKWRTAQELYAEDKLAWNLTETVGSAKAGDVAALRKSILQDTVAKWDAISSADRKPFEDKSTGARWPCARVRTDCIRLTSTRWADRQQRPDKIGIDHRR